MTYRMFKFAKTDNTFINLTHQNDFVLYIIISGTTAIKLRKIKQKEKLSGTNTLSFAYLILNFVEPYSFALNEKDVAN